MKKSENLSIKSAELEVLVNSKTLTLTVRDLRTGLRWRMQESGPGDIGIKGHCGPWQGFAFRDAGSIKWEKAENRLTATLTNWPYAANVWSAITSGLRLEFTLAKDELRISLSEYLPQKHEASIIDSYYPRGFLFPQKVDGNLVLPIGEGCLLSKKFAENLDLTLPSWVGLGFTMPWWGQLAESGEGFIATTHTPDDIAFRINTDKNGGQTVHPYWQASLGGLKYSRNLTYRFFAKTSVVELAKEYRRHAGNRGQAVTLKQKLTDRDKVSDLRGNMMLNVWMLSDFANFKQPGRVVFMKFAEACRRYQYLCQKAGIKKAIAHIDGWCRGGYDFNHPDVLPPDKRVGGWRGLNYFCEKLKEMEHRILLHDNYVDFYAHTPSFKNGGGVLDLSGIHSESDEWLGGRQRWLCSTQAKRYTDRNFNEIAEKTDIDGFYLDCWTIGHLRECFDQNHPATRTTTREAWSSIFADCQNRNWLIGSEAGNDWAVPFIDYCWGVHTGVIPSLLNDKVSQFGIPIPLHSLVWHDCLVCYSWISERKEDNAVIMEGATANNSLDPRLWAVLRGSVPTVRPECLDHPGKGSDAEMNNAVEFLKSLKPITDLHEKVGFEEMTDWQLLDSSGTAQSTTFADGTKVKVNFKENTMQIS